MAGKKRKSISQLSGNTKRQKSDSSSVAFVLNSDDGIARTLNTDVKNRLGDVKSTPANLELAFVPLPWFVDVAVSLELIIRRNDVPLLCGPVGCGKTLIIDHLAQKFCSETCRVQISEQTDTKALMGAYCCSTTPGVFVWRPGPLLHCMETGKWLILEDVDKGYADLPVLLSPILRRSRDCASDVIHPNTAKPVTRHPNFRLILTRRTSTECVGYFDQGSDCEIFTTHCSVIFMKAITTAVIERIVSIRNPDVLTLTRRLLSEFPPFKNLNFPNCHDQRPLSSRDFFKFFNRLNVEEGSTKSAETQYLDALDLFICSQAPSPVRDMLAVQLGGIFNLTVDRSTELWGTRRPELYLNSQLTKVEAGRASLPVKRSVEWELQLSSTSSSSTSQTFADTRLACTLVERLVVAVHNREPVLLVGETGTGKTSAVQRLARMAGRRLRVLNLNQQSDSVDLLGGFKPIDSRALVNPVRDTFQALFSRTFKLDTNRQFLGHIQNCYLAGNWRDLIKIMRHPAAVAIKRLSDKKADQERDDLRHPTVAEWQGFYNDLEDLEQRLLGNKGDGVSCNSSKSSLAFTFIEGALVRALIEGDWVLLDEINLAPPELLDCLGGLLDSSVGSLTLIDRGDVEPVKRHSSFHLFAAMNPSTDVGKRDLPLGLRNRFTELHVDELNPSVSSADREDLALLVRTYLVGLSPSAAQVSAVVQLYAAIKQAAVDGLVDGVGQRPYFSLRTLCRALTESSRGFHGSVVRSLYEGFLFSFGSQVGRSSRPTLEKLIQSHLIATVGSRATGSQTKGRGSDKVDENLCRQLFGKPLPSPALKTISQANASVPAECDAYVCVEGYWLPKGPQIVREVTKGCVADCGYVLTPSVCANLRDLSRVVAAAGSLPVLLQGETSVGKTSLITYLAGRVGQVCHRINNHEHTDLQTYLGAYTAASASSASSASLPLVFQEGIFVQAMKKGHWIILDELNLAPTEILEALNRVLDDNRELFITETQELVRAHPHFRVFATQNPPGLYAGRKVLSRALRNRFVELHFDPLPRDELEVILEHRSALPSSRAKKLVEVMHQLQLIRRSSDVFQGKDGFITLRDLFRWGERYRLANCAAKENLFDWDNYLAEQGYLLLAGRARRAEEASVVSDVIQKVFKRQICEGKLFDRHEEVSLAAAEFLALTDSSISKSAEAGTHNLGTEFKHIVWTRDMRRLLVLVGNALKYQEPVLLIGETGCGKTTVCQIFASLRDQKLHCVNCHQYTEASDFLGGLRPVRGFNETADASESVPCDDRLFEWVDGPLVCAMLAGHMFLLDEISLADDAVLERLNSVLEPERRLCLAERGGEEGTGIGVSDEFMDITAVGSFRLVATMNPGGDYAKKELSPALRNRFTEIWCPSPTFSPTIHNEANESASFADWQAIVEHNFTLWGNMSFTLENVWRPMSAAMVDFCWWFAAQRNDSVGHSICRRPMPTIRDLLAWVEFIQHVTSPVKGQIGVSRSRLFSACVHGAALLFLDSLGSSGADAADGNLLQSSDHSLENLLVHLKSPDNSSLKNFFTFTQLGGINRLSASLLLHFRSVTDFATLISQVLDAVSNVMAMISPHPGSGPQFSPNLVKENTLYGYSPFFIKTGPLLSSDCLDYTKAPLPFSLAAYTPASNLCRVLRALQLPRRALLLEGSPGVGKTSLVMALARASGHRVVRINLSEATEASDLFGCDLPVEGAGCGIFTWRDGPLLQALRHGYWILLDEMNLASQSVLECLNACLDHRGSIFIPELGTTFHVKPRETRLFACQNPVEEGGGRKALPKSFLNRFTQVYLSPLLSEDLINILLNIFPTIQRCNIMAMVRFNFALQTAVEKDRAFGVMGGHWEFNLRDLCRWGDLILRGQDDFGLTPGIYVYLLYVARMRTNEDKTKVIELWNKVIDTIVDIIPTFDVDLNRCYVPQGRAHLLHNALYLQVGIASFRLPPSFGTPCNPDLLILHQHRPYLELFLKTLQMGWMSILVGPRGSGKRSLVHLAAYLTQRKIVTISMSPTADTVELLGAFEQRENGGVFAWIDSPLVTGIREGHWVMLENAQLCSPSVLDRLNCLLEPNGELIMSERGLDASGNLVCLRPHTEFRLILTVDESSCLFGVGTTNISRAMRNRGVELAFTHELTCVPEDLSRILLATGLSAKHVSALLHFDASILTAVSCLLSDKISSDAILMSMRKPPVGALLSTGLIIQQLLTCEATNLLNTAHVSTEPESCVIDGVEWLLPDEHSSEQRVFLKALHDVYVKRLSDQRLAKLFETAVSRFVANDLVRFLSDECDCTEVQLLPVNRAVDLFSSPISPGFDEWLQSLRFVLACPSFAQIKLISPLIWGRLSKERWASKWEDTLAIVATCADSVDLFPATGLAELRRLGFTDELGKEILLPAPDVRWIPGWRELVRSVAVFSSDNLDNLIFNWNRLIVRAFFDHLRATFTELESRFVVSNSISMKNQFTLPTDTPVLLAAAKFSTGEYPATWAELYPGIRSLHQDWKAALELHSAAVITDCHNPFPMMLSSLARLSAWLHLFATCGIGLPSDWMERLEFHRRIARLGQLGVPPDRIMELIYVYRIAPSFGVEPATCLMGTANLNLSACRWSCLAASATEQLSTMFARIDTRAYEEDNQERENLNTEVPQQEPKPSVRYLGVRLWPVLLSGLVIAARNTSHRQHSATWDPSYSREVLIEFGLSVGALCRPKLLELLSGASESGLALAAEDHEPLHVLVDRCTTLVHKLLHSNMLESREVVSLPGLAKPDLTVEWCSLSPAIYLVTCGGRLSGSSSVLCMDTSIISCSLDDWSLSRQTYNDLYITLGRFLTACLQRVTVDSDSDLGEAIRLLDGLINSIFMAVNKMRQHRKTPEACLDHYESMEDDAVKTKFSRIYKRMKLLAEHLPQTCPEYLVRLVRFVCNCIDRVNEFNCKDSSAQRAYLWIALGSLQLYCSCPVSPLDPCVVLAHKISAAKRELTDLDDDLAARAALRRVEFGSCCLPPVTGTLHCHGNYQNVCCLDDSVSCLSNVASSLEHPLIGALVARRTKVARKLQKLQAQLIAMSESESVLSLRSANNPQYAALRRRMQTFVANFAEELITGMCPDGVYEGGSFEVICPSIQFVSKFMDAVDSLSEWLLQPDMRKLYADIVEPYLLGLSKIIHGLRICRDISAAKDSKHSSLVRTVELLSCGLFPLLGNTPFTDRSEAPPPPAPLVPSLSPRLQLAKLLVSPPVRACIKLAWLPECYPQWMKRSIFTDTGTSLSSSRFAALASVEADYGLSSHVLDLLLLEKLSSRRQLSTNASEDNHALFIARLLKVINAQLSYRWRRHEARRKREAERHAALFVEAESRRQKCLSELRSATSGDSSSKSSAKKATRKSRKGGNDADCNLPELVDPDLCDEIDWRLRFSEAGAIEAQCALRGGSANNVTAAIGLNLSRDDQIRQTVERIEDVNNWLEGQIAAMTEAASADWMPPDGELVKFIDRQLYLLRLLTVSYGGDLDRDLVLDQHWWNTFMQGYQFAGRLQTRANYSLPISHDAVSSAAHILATARLVLVTGGDVDFGNNDRLFSLEPLSVAGGSKTATASAFVRRKRCLDIYREAIPPAQARRALEISVQLKTRVLGLLEEWPEHPALTKILVIIRRMGDFSMRDCLMKYITAFEMLLTEMQEWEKNAARYVSLSELFKVVCAMLVDWRKLELKCWMASLDAATQAAADRCCPLWFHLHAIFLEPPAVTKSVSNSPDTLVNSSREQCQALLEFMENGPVGEFIPRWRLLGALYRAIQIWPGVSTEVRATSLQTVGNVVWFYAQFVDHISKSLSDQQQPIRKEMKGFISVMKWGDYTGFWSMKENVDRCKKTIHKHIKSWEAILRQSVKPFFESAISVDIDVPFIKNFEHTLQLISEPTVPRQRLLEPNLRQWLLNQHAVFKVPETIARLPTLISRFQKHVSRISTDSDCLQWINKLKSCYADWSSRVRDLSKATKLLDAESPPPHILAAVIEDREPSAGTSITKRRKCKVDVDEQEKAKKWRSKYTALQQSKKLALFEWFRVASGRRSFANDLQNPMSGDVTNSSEHAFTSLIAQDIDNDETVDKKGLEDTQTVEIVSTDDEVCLGLFHRRGLRHNFFEKPFSHLLVELNGKLWEERDKTFLRFPSKNIVEEMVANNAFTPLQTAASEGLCRLFALRSALPRHPEGNDVFNDLGGLDGVERLLGSIDDLLGNCIAVLKPIGDLGTAYDALLERLSEVTSSFRDHTLQSFPCSPQIIRKLRASRLRIADLSADCVSQWIRFWETCSFVSTIHGSPSPTLASLLADNADILPTRSVPNGLSDPSSVLTLFRGRLEAIATRLNQPLPQNCLLLTSDVLTQQEVLQAAAGDFIVCCQEIKSFYDYVSETAESEVTVSTCLSSTAASILGEVEVSSAILLKATTTVVAKSFTEDQLDRQVVDIIRCTLLNLEALQSIDVHQCGHKSSPNLMDCLTSTCDLISKSCVPKLNRLISQLHSLFSLVCPAKLSERRSGYVRCLMPLLQSLSELLVVRLRHTWGLLFAWLFLGEFLAQVTFRLLNDGFCKPAVLSKTSATGGEGNQESSVGDGQDASNAGDQEGGCTSLTAQGVDTTGAKDVSDQLESQEQIEGTQQQHEKETGPEDRNLNDANGIEMPEDFTAAFADDKEQPEDAEAGNEEEEDSNMDEIDDKIGDGTNPNDMQEEVNHEMWASDSEEEELDNENKERENDESKSAGVNDPYAKSKQSESTAKDKSGADGKEDHKEDEDESSSTPNDDVKTDAKSDDDKRPKPDSGKQITGCETVAGSDEGERDNGTSETAPMPEQPSDSDAIKRDDELLAQQEAERIADEVEQNTHPEEAADDTFGENIDSQNDLDDFEELNNEEKQADGIELNAETMDVDDEAPEDNQMNIEESGPGDDEEPHLPESDLASYQPGAGDLNSGHSSSILNLEAQTEESLDQPSEIDPTNEYECQPPPGAQPVGDGANGEDSLASGSRPKPSDQQSNQSGDHQTQQSRQKSQGPRPTSDQRTTLSDQDGISMTEPLRQSEILEASEDVENAPPGGDDESGSADAVQHVHEMDADTTMTALDSATDAQKQQSESNEPLAEKNDTQAVGADPNTVLPEPMQDVPVEAFPVAPKSESLIVDENEFKSDTARGNDVRSLPKANMEIIETSGACRPPESQFFTQNLDLPELVDALASLMPSSRTHVLDREVLAAAAVDWCACVSRSFFAAVQLCESLRLVLEPTRASRMKGDFRVGKRLNMRKIIPYLASQFRKDKIWMRRTQPSQRDYRILIAVDDSSSMADNLCRQMTFEALATVVSALNLLEAGKIGVCSFGESVQVVHGLGEPWSNDIGAAMLAQFTFAQTRTSLTKLLLTSVSLMKSAGDGGGKSPASQLLLILSDGVFSEDPQSPQLQSAVRMARDNRLFIVCIVIDDAKKKHSIFDLRRYAGPGKLLPYMDNFPLPYYLVLRDVTALPQLLVDALRQWFELASVSGHI